MPQKIRDSSFELLRIVCMFAVISAHIIPHSLSPIFANTVYAYSTAGLFFADIYFMISGFFMILRPAPTYKKIYSLLITIYMCAFLSLAIFLACKISGLYGYSDMTLTNYMGLVVHYFVSPITSNKFWFVTAYVILFILLPILNPLLNSYSKKGYVVFLLAMLFMYSIANSFNFKYVHIERAVLDYALGGFFALFVKPSEHKVRHNAILIPLTILLVIMTALVNIHYANTTSGMFFHIAEKTFLNGVLFPICAISIFSIFLNLSFKNRFINAFSKTTFSVYLLHGNMMIGPLWPVFLFALNIEEKFFIPKAIANTLVAFAVCAALDYFVIEKLSAAIKPITDACYEKASSLLLKSDSEEKTE